MCGRVSLKFNKIDHTPDYFSNTRLTWRLGDEVRWGYNMSPTATLPIVRTAADGVEAIPARWWLVPPFVKDVKAWKATTFNARSESLEDSKIFKRPWTRAQRCVVPVAAIYEWKREGTQKQPYAIMRREALWTLLAGLWEEGSTGVSCTIVTMAPNALFGQLHDRMPLVLDEAGALEWINPDVSAEQARAMVTPWNPAPYQAYPVSQFVNSSRNEGPECLEPVGDPLPG